ncbi:MAG: DUF1631 domain-containing protein [Candidatus Sedimenticola sp. (ex Thyasira tokunagai)]
MAATNNIIAFGSLQNTDVTVSFKEEYRGSVNACRQVILKLLPKRMDALFQRLDDNFYVQADKADSNHQQTLYFDAMRELRRQRDPIESHFNQRLLEGYDIFWRQGPSDVMLEKGVDFSMGDFSLVEAHDLEEELAVGSMISRGEGSYFRELYALDRRFSHLLNDLEVSGKYNPLSPAKICTFFSSAINGLPVDLRVKLVVYKQFELEVVDKLSGLYDEVNTVLARAGVLPQLKHGVRRSSAGSVPVPAREERAPVTPDNEAEVALSSELFVTLQQLLDQRRITSGGAQIPSSQMQVVNTNDVLSALSALQQGGPSAGEVRGGLFQVLGVAGEGKSGKVINQSDEDALDVISMLFEFILDDPGLADGMRALLARLQIPMLKVAILDKSFFSKKEHPARRLLNSLAQSAVGWSEDAGRDEGGLYNEIESVVGRILSEFSDDIGLFKELNQQFDAFSAQQQRGAQVTEKRASQVTQGKEQLLRAKKSVQKQITASLAGRTQVPEVAMTLIQEGWKDVLQLISLRQGLDSEAWKDAVQMMDRLLWSVEPKRDKSEQQKLLKTIPELLRGLRAGLGDISFDQHKMTRLFKELQVCHVNCLRGGGSKIKMVEAKSQTVEEESESAGPFSEEIILESGGGGTGAVAKDAFYDTAASLEIGTWLELNDDRSGGRRVKLSWRSEVTDRCLFVNHRGVKVEEISVHGLAIWFRSGRATVIEAVGEPLMDRALGAMLKVLKKGESAEVSNA